MESDEPARISTDVSGSLQLQSLIFSKIPLEIREKIYLNTLEGSGPVQHIYHGQDRSRLRSMSGRSERELFLGFPGGQHDASGSRFRHEPCDVLFHPGFDRVVFCKYGPHWQSLCPFLGLLLTCRRMYHEVLPVMGSVLEIVFTDMEDARTFLLDLRPPIVDHIRTIHMAWGVIWRANSLPDPSKRHPEREPSRDPYLYVDLWQAAHKLPRIREVKLWLDWQTSQEEMSEMILIIYSDGKIVGEPEQAIRWLSTVLVSSN